MGWNIFLTNVPRAVWPAKALAPLYRLRWRIEMIFKAWKSHLGLRQFNARSEALLRLSVMSRLLFCVLVYRFCQALELPGDTRRLISLLRLARIIGQCACRFAVASCKPHHLPRHVFYEQRQDRKNYFEFLADLLQHSTSWSDVFRRERLALVEDDNTAGDVMQFTATSRFV